MDILVLLFAKKCLRNINQERELFFFQKLVFKTILYFRLNLVNFLFYKKIKRKYKDFWLIYVVTKLHLHILLLYLRYPCIEEIISITYYIVVTK